MIQTVHYEACNLCSQCSKQSSLPVASVTPTFPAGPAATNVRTAGGGGGGAIFASVGNEVTTARSLLLLRASLRVASAMSATGEQDPAPGGQSQADEEASPDPKPLLDDMVPVEWLVVMMGAMVLLAFRTIVRNFEEKANEQEVPQPTFDWDQDEQLVNAKDEEEKEGEEEDREERGEAAERKLQDAETVFKLKSSSHDIMAPKSLSLLAKQALFHYYQSFDEEIQGECKEEEEKENKNEEPEGYQK
ncbi:uncharacterized protein LOC104855253 [Fukomys damarensis]|uniref:uncharacterized protein LOC104855253 n=1 Tax=Fukomys damarensis TaxID=885580 RepID=UPI00053FD5B6|nr:uncharacterized protein LOC104855253 [Fukomys damarensis]